MRVWTLLLFFPHTNGWPLTVCLINVWYVWEKKNCKVTYYRCIMCKLDICQTFSGMCKNFWDSSFAEEKQHTHTTVNLEIKAASDKQCAGKKKWLVRSRLPHKDLQSLGKRRWYICRYAACPWKKSVHHALTPWASSHLKYYVLCIRITVAPSPLLRTAASSHHHHTNCSDPLLPMGLWRRRPPIQSIPPLSPSPPLSHGQKNFDFFLLLLLPSSSSNTRELTLPRLIEEGVLAILPSSLLSPNCAQWRLSCAAAQVVFFCVRGSSVQGKDYF